jgi:hypothetical protein
LSADGTQLGLAAAEPDQAAGAFALDERPQAAMHQRPRVFYSRDPACIRNQFIVDVQCRTHDDLASSLSVLEEYPGLVIRFECRILAAVTSGARPL